MCVCVCVSHDFILTHVFLHMRAFSARSQLSRNEALDMDDDSCLCACASVCVCACVCVCSHVQEGEKDVPTQMANGGQLRGPVEVPNSRSVKALSTVAGSAALLPTSRLASATTKVPLHLPLLVPLGAGSNAEKSAAGNKIPSMTSTP